MAALALVALSVAACGGGGGRRPPPLPPNVRMRPDGSCWYYPPNNCPPANLTTCEAIPPQRVACPR
ncbi:MAG: hypothetical protein R3B72_15475 [Polyangiaceae bacterium]